MMIKKIVNALDIYGVPIGVNYKGESTYKTKVGALMSLFTVGLTLALAVSKVMMMVARENVSILQTTTTLDLLNPTDSFNLKEQYMEFVFALQDKKTGDYIKIP